MEQDRKVREHLQRTKDACEVYKLTMKTIDKQITSGVGIFSNETVEKYTEER